MQAFGSLFPLETTALILDVGGTPEIWSGLPQAARVVLLNLPRARNEVCSPQFLHVEGDGCQLPFADQSFDIVFSNSVIEHVGSRSAQQAFAAEVMRVGRSYWVQTPNRYFPVETHLLTPFVHWLPKRAAGWVIRRFTFWQMFSKVTKQEKLWYLNHFIDDIRLLSAREMKLLFPGAQIRSEHFLGFKKSLIATNGKFQ